MLRFSMPGGRRATAGLATLALAVGLATPLTAAASTSASSPAPTASPASSPTALQALAKARTSGRAVPVPGATTDVSTLTADPNGTMSLSESPIPVRKKVGSSWQDLDATLVKNADGSISPRLSANALRISGGGTAPLASLTADGDHLAIALPTTLPSPALSGDTATYANVAPGVDLVVTANALGGFSDTFVVHNAAAAAGPALAALLKSSVTGTGLSVGTDHGAVTATDRSGRVLFASNTPVVWDSSTDAAPARATANATANALGAARSGGATSTVFAPGARAHVGALTPALSGSTLTLSPDASVLRGGATAYPAYIDPTWNPTATTNNGWATVAEQYPGQTYWNTTAQGGGYMAVGDGVADDPLLARSLVNFPLPASTLAGSTISSAVFSATDEYSGACPDGAEDEQMDVDAPSATLDSGNADWDSWDTSGDVGPTIGSKSFAYGYSSSCGAAGSPSSVSIPLSTATFTNDVHAGRQTQTLALVADNESSEYGWKEFIYSTAQLTITYDMTPAITKAAADSVGCGTASDPGVLGKGDVQLVAGVYQKDGSSLTTDFRLYNSGKTTEYNPASTTGATTSAPSAIAATSGTNAVLTVQSTFFEGFSTTAKTTFAWTVSATDNTLTSPTTTCYFTYDPTSPGEPTLYDSTGTTLCSADAQSYTVGSPAGFAVDYNTSGSEPTTYYYQLDAAAPIAVPATGGDATFTLKPTEGSNVLSIDAAGSSGNIGTAATCYFNAKAPANAGDRDLTGDGTPDLLTTGTGTGTTPSGLWLATGTRTGTVAADPTDIGVNGAGLAGGPADYTGAQAVTGQFTGNGFNDVLAYYPAGSTLNGTTSPLTGAEGLIVTGTGDGSPLQAEDSANVNTIYAATLADNNGLYPTQIANAYHADSGNTNTAYPDLIGTAGSSTAGYYLDYYPSTTSIGGYYTQSLSNALTIAMNTPDGTADWSAWTIATAQVGTAVDMYLWNQTTGALYLWTGISVADNGDNTGTLSYTNSYPIYDGTSGHTWNKGTALHTLEAADINGDGTPDLWTVDGSGNVTAYLVSGLSTTADATTVTAGTPQALTMATHDWPLNDSASAAHDNATSNALTLTGLGGVYTHTGDLFSPDVDFTGTNGQLAAAGSALDLTKSFTISLWTKPMAYGSMPISQDGTRYPGMMLYPTQSGWQFYLSKDNGAASWSGDDISGGSVQLGAWAHLQATYDAGTKVMSLYVDNTFVATGSHTAPTTGATGDFRLGSNIDNGAQASFYTGQDADLQTWSGQALAPNQPYTPASYHQSVTPERLLDTRSTTGDTLTSGTTSADTPIGANSTVTLQIVGDSVTPTVSGAPTAIPASATAVAIDVTVVSQTANGNLIAYADGSQRPITSSTNFPTTGTTTGYQIVPIGLDGKIALYNTSGGTTHLLVDLTGYYTSDATLAGDQTYHPLASAYRALDTANSTAGTNLHATGPVAAGSTFTLQVTGVDAVPADATDVAINLTAFNQSGSGLIEAYAAGTSEPTDTSMTYYGTQTASMAADVNLSSSGQIAVNNVGSSQTDVIGDISGYFTTDKTGQVYHTVNPTRLVDTRSGIGGTAGAVAGDQSYTLTGADTQQITMTPAPTLALMLTATAGAQAGDAVAYPAGATQPTTSNVNWVANQAIANLALTPTSSAGSITVDNQSTGATEFVIDCSGYFANS